jgi:hypothetical protein
MKAMKMSCWRSTAFFLLLATGGLLGMTSPGHATKERVVELVLKKEVRGATLTYVQHNPATSVYPCSDLKLKTERGAIKRRSLCVFINRIDERFDIRKDVSSAGFENARLDDDALRFTLDVSLRGPDSFLLDCVVPYTANAIGKQSCQLRDRT